jgi:hypothetical protein
MLLEYLRQKLINGGVTFPVYINFAPPEPDDVIMIRSVANRAPDVGHLYDRPSLQIIARSARHNTAIDNAMLVYHLLHQSGNISDGPVIDIQALQSPYFAGQDDQDRYVYTFILQSEVVREYDYYN